MTPRTLSQGLTLYTPYVSYNKEIQQNETYASGIRLIPLFPSLNCGLSQLKSITLSRIIHIHIHLSSVHPSFLSTTYHCVMNYKTEGLSLDTWAGIAQSV